MNISIANSIRLEEPLAPPIFIVSTERSGSTLLRYIIDTHSQICCPGELAGGSLCAHLQLLLSRTVCQPGNNLSDSAESSARALTITRQVFSGIMNAYARARGKSVWCDKTPSNITHVGLLGQLFPTARFLCLYRNCVDVVHSCLEASKHGFMTELAPYAMRNPGNLVAAMTESWLEKTEQILAFESSNASRCFRIRYEDLVYSPEECLQGLFRFLRLNWEPDILMRTFKTHHDPGGGDAKINFTKEIDRSSVGRGTTLPLDRLSSELESRLKRVLNKLEYLTATPQHASTAFVQSRPQASDSPRSRTVQQIFATHIPARLKESAAMLAGTHGTLKFEITGEGTRIWIVKLQGERSMVVEGDQPADCTIVAPEDVFIAVADGKLNAYTAYMTGGVQLRGNPELVNKLVYIL